MSRLSTIAPRLAQLLPRLASQHDGEVVASVRAIQRTLRGAGLDWHDLAAALTSPVATMTFQPRPARRPPTPRQPRDEPTGEGHRSLLAMMAAYCSLAAQDILNVEELSFAVSMANLLRLGRKLGPRQEARLRALYEKVRAPA